MSLDGNAGLTPLAPRRICTRVIIKRPESREGNPGLGYEGNTAKKNSSERQPEQI